MSRVEVKKELIRWARERSGLTESDLTERFPKFEQWERGEAFPTLKQLEAYGLAIAASVLAIVFSPSNLLGLAIGIWRERSKLPRGASTRRGRA